MLVLEGFALKKGVNGAPNEPVVVIRDGRERYFMTEKEMAEQVRIANGGLKEWGSDSSQRDMVEGFRRNRTFYTEAIGELRRHVARDADLGPAMARPQAALVVEGYALKKGTHGRPDEPAAVIGEGREQYFMTEHDMAEQIRNADKMLKEWGSDPAQREMVEGLKRNKQFYSHALEGLHDRLALGTTLGKPLDTAADFRAAAEHHSPAGATAPAPTLADVAKPAERITAKGPATPSL